jgi:alpha-L-rhamnosidase
MRSMRPSSIRGISSCGQSGMTRVFCACVLLILGSNSIGAQSLDGRGPIVVSGRRTLVTADGVETESSSSEESAPEREELPLWEPTWIGLSSGVISDEGPVLFRKEFDLATKTPGMHASLLVSADPYYRLWVNGVLVARGPDDAGSDYSPHERWSHRWLANRVEVAAYLKNGRNVIAAEVFPDHRGSFSLGKTALALRMSINNGVSDPIIVKTGEDWLVKRCTAYSWGPLDGDDATSEGKGDGSSEGPRYDARLEENDWHEIGFGGRGWIHASIISPVWGPVAISHLPAMMEAVWPIKSLVLLPAGNRGESLDKSAGDDARKPIHLSSGESLRVKYDRVLSGYFSFSAEGETGAQITFSTRENKKAGEGRQSFQVTLRKGVTTFEESVLDSFSAVDITVSHANGPVVLRDVRATFVSQPVRYVGSFTSSDASLNALWKAARWQTQLCLQDRFLDSPDHLEPIGDGGDYLIESQVADYAFGPIQLTGQFLRQFAKILDGWEAGHPSGAVNFHTSYSLLWLQMLLDNYDATGDDTLARELAPSAYRLLDRYASWIGSNGLVSEAPNYLFMDWVKIGGFNAHHPPAVIGQGYLSALYYRGLADGLRLAQMTGDQVRVERYTEQRSALLQAFNKELWDEKTGTYRDGRPFLNHNPTSENMLPPDREIETHSPQVNALAVLYDIAPVDRQPSILKRALIPDPTVAPSPAPQDNPLDTLNVQPYFMHFVLSAEAHAGVFGIYAAQQLAQWKINPATKTFPEMWRSGDWSHGWGGTPAIQMSAHVLGVASRSPGFNEVALAPVPLKLSYAKGSVPTPHGDVVGSWSRVHGRFIYEVSLPPGTRGRLDLRGLQTTSAQYSSVDGSASKPYLEPVMLAAGKHRIVVSLLPSSR